MKKVISINICFFLTLLLQAQPSITENVSVTLASLQESKFVNQSVSEGVERKNVSIQAVGVNSHVCQKVVLDYFQPNELKLKSSQNTFDILLGSVLKLDQYIVVEGGVAPYKFHWKNAEWEGDSVNNELNISPQDSTIYHLIVYDNNGCSVSDNYSVNVVFPLKVSSEKIDAGCFGGNGGSLTLKVMQGAPPYSFVWNNGETTSQISGLIAGEYQVVISDKMGQVYIQRFEIFEHLEFNSTIEASICESEGYHFGNSRYSESGQYSDTLISVFGCDSIINLSLTVIPNYNDTVEVSICFGESYLYRDKLYNQSGIFTDSLHSSMGCDSLFNLRLKVNPIPEKPFITMSGDTLTSSAIQNQWFENGIAIPGATDQHYSINKTGNFHVVAYNEHGCSSISDEISHISSHVPIIEKEYFDCILYPNPSNGVFTIKLVSEEMSEYNVFIVSIEGKIISSIKIESDQNNREIPIVFEQLPKGIYMLRVASKQNTINRKIIIQ